MNLTIIIAVAASICTAIAGILHLTMLPAPNTNMTILFLVGGIGQIFWVIPTIRRWGLTWDCIGIAGTIAFILIWTITRMPDNPITGRAGRVGESAIIIEIFQIAFVVLLGLLISKQKASPNIKT
ncbi:hypothetical protein [Candidatus Nitrosocosmicus franklandus]|uniref:Uncharacterized protein n=1 Tax=Candidatus Nitrosocosmicus franklandianus TaxID=1798806 RepID=A0A484I9B3_9ARCH|nr:hypothetical protein [Candidatus Nitrosocosmicus franklandus]VFJ13402.1 conserved membrane protein of unknown function [Candidatus Nitrosocosmicus franklandus]